MVFLFFEDIQRTPSPGFAPCQSPSGGVSTAAQTAHRTPGTPPEYTNTPTAKKRRTTPHRTPHSVHQHHSTNTPQTEPQHRTRAAIQYYTLQQPGRSSRPQRRTGGIEGNRKRPEPKPGALRLIYSFSTGRREPPAEKSKCKLKSSFHPLTEP